MKIGFCGGMDRIKMFSGDIMDYAEANLTKLNGMSEGEIKELLSISDATGIPFETANCFFPPKIKLCGEQYSKNAVKEYCNSALYKGKQLGLKLAVIGSGSARNVDDGSDRDECFKQLEESFSLASSIAEQYGITVVLEPLNSTETNVFNSVEEGADFVKKLNHPNMFLLADIYHLSKENEPYQTIVDNRDLIKHMHIARGETRKFPKADDGFDYKAVKDAVDKASYNMRISIEGGPYDDYDSEIIQSVKFLKSIFC